MSGDRAGRVGVVVVTYSPGETLTDFLDTLAATTTAAHHVIVADNGSTDGAPEDAAGRNGVELLRTGGNLGYGGAANLGVRGADGEWVVVANPDLRWHDGALDELLAATRRWPGAGAFGPLIVDEAGTLYPSARELPSLVRGIGHALLGWWWPSNPFTAAYRRERGEPTEGVTGWLSGSCLLLRREAFDAVGGFDTGYFMYFEDLDLCERLGRAGWPSVYVPSARVTHLGGVSTSRHAAAMTDAHHASAWRYLSRRYAGPRLLPLRLVLRVGLALRAALARRVPTVATGARPARRRR